MSPIDKRLIAAAPTSKEALLELLFDGLDWPKPDHLQVEDVDLIDWDPEELHLEPEALARIARVQQVPRLTAQQPFAVFIIQFEPGRLPIGALRRLVHSLVRRRRADGGSSAQWDLPDLLFFCQTEGLHGVLHIVSFRDVQGRQVLRTISWESTATPARLDLLASQLPGLSWPTGAEPDLGMWREAWHGTFRSSYREGIRTASQLALAMADIARRVRDDVTNLLAVETEEGPLKKIWSQVRLHLREDLDAPGFADMYAETMVYGLLTARITHPEDFTGATTHLAFENAFLDALYGMFRQTDGEDVDIDELGLLDLADLLARIDVDDILANFGSSTRVDDPVIYFYEEFLDRYDRDKRRRLGTYYTPIPVVRWMVAAVDDILRGHLGLAGGIADETAWGTYAREQGIPLPPGVDPASPVVRMIDPATGTGTFLLEWIRRATTSTVSGDPGSRSAVMLDLLNRVDAFEIDLPGYTVAHLKVSLELPADVRRRVEPHILLADSLADRKRARLFDENPIAREGRRAEEVKFDTRHSICIGNPPWDVMARDAGGGMVVAPNEGQSLFSLVLDPATSRTRFSHLAHLYNLYVYFWIWAIWKCFMQTAYGPAVVAFITPSGWLTGPGFMGLRKLMREVADDIYVLDLGGDQRGARVDENVFEIQTPNTIAVLVRRGHADESTPARVRYARISGSRDEKFEYLERESLAQIDWREVSEGWLETLVPPTGDGTWQRFSALADLFPWQQPGVKFNRTWPIAPSSNVLQARWQEFVASDTLEERSILFYTGTSGRTIYTQVAGGNRLCDLTNDSPCPPRSAYAYRSFDRQWALADPRLAQAERPSLWASVSETQIFMAVPMTAQLSNGPAATCSTAVPDLHVYNGRGGKDIIPLYRDAAGTPNTDPAVLSAITAAHHTLDPEAAPVTVERLFSYCYGVLSGADYASRFAEALATPGPRIPVTADPGLFALMVEHGETLLWLDTFAERCRSVERTDLQVANTIAWESEPRRGPASARDVAYDPAIQVLTVGDGRLSGVPLAAWSFEVGGMPVMEKWLGYRSITGIGRAATRPSSPLDAIRHEAWSPEWSEELRRVVYVLMEHALLQTEGTRLLDEILSNDLIEDLPVPSPTLREAPVVGRAEQPGLDL